MQFCAASLAWSSVIVSRNTTAEINKKYPVFMPIPKLIKISRFDVIREHTSSFAFLLRP